MFKLLPQHLIRGSCLRVVATIGRDIFANCMKYTWRGGRRRNTRVRRRLRVELRRCAIERNDYEERNSDTQANETKLSNPYENLITYVHRHDEIYNHFNLTARENEP